MQSECGWADGTCKTVSGHVNTYISCIQEWRNYSSDTGSTAERKTSGIDPEIKIKK